MSLVKQKLQALLSGLDANDKERAVEAIVSFYDQYVISLPGPDNYVKKKGRPYVVKAAENLVADWCVEAPATLGEAIGQVQAAVFGGLGKD